MTQHVTEQAAGHLVEDTVTQLAQTLYVAAAEVP